MYQTRRRYRYVLFVSLLLLAVMGSVNAQQVERVTGGVKEQPAPKSAEEVVDTAAKIQLQSPIFKDTMSISKVTAISFVAPGFAQLYNRHYWKIPVLYGTVGGFTYLALRANKNYKNYKSQYDNMRNIYGVTRSHIDPIQEKMNKYNTQRTIFWMGAALSYIYFIGDGAVNYPNRTNPVKKATTLAMIFPGAGQIYNKSYWKVPIVIGAFATMGYIIDFNNRGFQRMREAYNRYPNDEFNGRYPQSSLQNMRDQYRRNRDLSIILTCGLYLLSVVEAHVDAYLKDYDISDDLSLRVEPTMIDMKDIRVSNNNGYSGFGLSLKVDF